MKILGVDPGKTTGFALYDTQLGAVIDSAMVDIDVAYMEQAIEFDDILDEFLVDADVVVMEETVIAGQRVGEGKQEQVVADFFVRYIVASCYPDLPVLTVKPEVGKHPSVKDHPAVREVSGAHAKSAARLAIFISEEKDYVFNSE